jgi:hypothetical protein
MARHHAVKKLPRIVEAMLLADARAGKEKSFHSSKIHIPTRKRKKWGVRTRRSESMLRCKQPSKLQIAIATM